MDRSGTVARLKHLSPWHATFCAFALGLFLFLAVRASNPDRWSDWDFGDAQTLLSLRQWNEGGWLANYLLFVPQGYAKVVKHLDEPGLWQHAHGIAPGPERRVGPRLRYTHYPAGYLVPYATLYRLGFPPLPAARLLSCVFSVAALVFLYLLFARLTAPSVALISAAFYGLSPVFLGFADSLANQPLDDLLRFAFLLAVVLSTRAATGRREKALLAAAWGLEFLLSLSSFDSVFFLYLWLIGWDLLNGLGFRWRRYLLFSLAPLTAHGLQFLQNVWYLGLHDAWADVAGVGGEIGMPEGRGAVILFALRSIAEAARWSPLLWLGCAGALLACRRFRRDQELRPPLLGLLLLLGGCGLAYVVLLPGRANMGYQGRQFLPALALLAGAATCAAGRLFSALWKTRPTGASLLHALGVCLALGAFWVQFALADRRPATKIDPADPQYLVAKKLRSLPTAYEPVFLSVEGFSKLHVPLYRPGYPQVNPALEYYAGSRPILCFSYVDLLVKDLRELALRSKTRFSPVLVSLRLDLVQQAVEELRSLGVIENTQFGPRLSEDQGCYILDLTPVMRWE